MSRALNTILLKTISTGFYKQHAGLLLGTFLGGGAYLFFIGVLNQTHFTHAEIFRLRLVFILTLINSTFIAALIAGAWIAYTVKTWKYTATQLALPQHEFLRYSATAISLRKQRVAWALTQTVIMLPPIAFIAFALAVGVIYNEPLTIPLALLLFIAALIALSAYRNVWLLNRLTDKHTNHYLHRIIGRWPKPYATLPLYQILYHEKITLIITKLLALALLYICGFLLTDDQHETRTLCLVTIIIPITNSILIYYAYRFETRYLTFARNLPYSNVYRYRLLLMEYLLLTFPESLWLIYWKPGAAPLLIAIHLALGITLRCITYRTRASMQHFLTYTFVLLISSFLTILFHAQLLLIPTGILYALFIFHRHYHTTDHPPAP